MGMKVEEMRCNGKRDCEAIAEWLIGTAHIPVCAKHHLKWLQSIGNRELFLNSRSYEVKRIAAPRGKP